MVYNTLEIYHCSFIFCCKRFEVSGINNLLMLQSNAAGMCTCICDWPKKLAWSNCYQATVSHVSEYTTILRPVFTPFSYLGS